MWWETVMVVKRLFLFIWRIGMKVYKQRKQKEQTKNSEDWEIWYKKHKWTLYKLLLIAYIYKVSKTLDRLGFEIARYAVRDWDSRDVYVYSRKKSRKNGGVGKNCWNWRDKLKRERKFHE